MQLKETEKGCRYRRRRRKRTRRNLSSNQPANRQFADKRQLPPCYSVGQVYGRYRRTNCKTAFETQGALGCRIYRVVCSRRKPRIFQGVHTGKTVCFLSGLRQVFSRQVRRRKRAVGYRAYGRNKPPLALEPYPHYQRKVVCKRFVRRKTRRTPNGFLERSRRKIRTLQGEPNSQAEHLDTAEYKAKKIVEAAEQKRAEAEEYSEALQQAEQGEFAHSKSGLRKQIVAVTAENADLKKRLDKVMQETLDIDKENKEFKAYKVRAAKALELLAKLERENPSAYNALFESKQKPPTSSSKNWWSK